LIFGGYWINGLWIAFIGWFLENAAAQSWHQFTLGELLKGHKVSEVLTRDWPQVPPDLTLEELVHDHFLSSFHRCLPVIEAGQLQGIVTIHNLQEVPREEWPTTQVAQVMIPRERVKSIAPDEEVSAALQLMTQEDVHQLPVMSDGRLVGMIARDNVLAFIRTRAELGV
ncbi:MAG: CBS domain-containing protein, partial [Candidatus Bipolaricaulia bacterium]